MHIMVPFHQGGISHYACLTLHRFSVDGDNPSDYNAVIDTSAPPVPVSRRRYNKKLGYTLDGRIPR